MQTRKNSKARWLAMACLPATALLLMQCTRTLDPQVKIDRIVIEKGKRKMSVYAQGECIKKYAISLGRNPTGDKVMKGDNKTPEGTYYINGKNPHSKYHNNLGISYPNSRDVAEAGKLGARAGGDIKIHGLSDRFAWIGKLHLCMDWTAGCIAVTNREMDELYDAVAIGTPVEIRK